MSYGAQGGNEGFWGYVRIAEKTADELDGYKDRIGKTVVDRFVMTNLLLNIFSRPDFIAYNHKHAEQLSYRLCRRLYKVVGAAWTIRSEAGLSEALEKFEIIIFDGFVPGKIRKRLESEG